MKGRGVEVGVVENYSLSPFPHAETPGSPPSSADLSEQDPGSTGWPTTSPTSVTFDTSTSSIAPLHSIRRRNAINMSLARTARFISAPRARLQLIPNLTAARAQQQRNISSTPALRAGDHAHEDHYDSPSGWLFNVKPGEKYENEGWENIWYYGFFGSMIFGLVGYCYKPDTR